MELMGWYALPMITGTDACTQRIEQMTDQTDDQMPVDGEALTPKPVDDSLPADPAIKPEQDAKSPIRAKRHLRLVPDTGEPEAPKAKTKKGSLGAVKGGTNRLTGLTDKQEAFAVLVVSGKTASEAYRMAYDTNTMRQETVWTEACMLLANPKVARRIESLNVEKEQQRRMMSVSRAERVLQRLETLADSATTEAVKVRANELLGKTAGLFTDKVEIEDKTDRSTADLEQSIAERLARLGIAR